MKNVSEQLFEKLKVLYIGIEVYGIDPCDPFNEPVFSEYNKLIASASEEQLSVLDVIYPLNDSLVKLLHQRRSEKKEEAKQNCSHCHNPFEVCASFFIADAVCDKCLELPEYNQAICCDCGRSVAFGSGNFVNRIPNFNDYNIRLEMGVPYPRGAFVCDCCDTGLRPSDHLFLCVTG